MPDAVDATVVIVHLNDVRVVDAARSVLAGTTLPQRILIADGGSRPGILAQVARSLDDPRVQVRSLPGPVAKTRADALDAVDTRLVCFLDADETASTRWLAALTRPLLEGAVDFTGGPTRPAMPPRNGPQRYVQAAESRLNDLARADVCYLAGGNTAWRASSLRRIGGFDPRMGRAGEDYDANLRAAASGLRGRWVEEAWVHHDQSRLDTYGKILRRKYTYFVGGALAYLKNGSLRRRGAASARRWRPHHWIDAADLVLKPLALARARHEYRRRFRSMRPEALAGEAATDA